MDNHSINEDKRFREKIDFLIQLTKQMREGIIQMIAESRKESENAKYKDGVAIQYFKEQLRIMESQVKSFQDKLEDHNRKMYILELEKKVGKKGMEE